ncbi:MAG TPA: hypothetical protein DCS97_08300 [Planctomycetes bacterium]|nr:hypothetical protein [Planctomycetota bacterium]
MLSAEQLSLLQGITARARQVGACLVLTQGGNHLTCVVAQEAAVQGGDLVLRHTRIVRFVDNGWAVQAEAELQVVRDGAHWGVCDPARRWWVPHHSLLPYRLVDLAATEHVRLLGHLDESRPWDVFKHIQLLYLGEEGFGGGRDALTVPAGYGAVARPDRWYVTPAVRG